VSEEKKVVLTREYVINLRRVYEVSRTKRAKYAVGLIRRFVARHLKVEPRSVKVGQRLNRRCGPAVLRSRRGGCASLWRNTATGQWLWS